MPLLERLRFLCIVSSNLDEFFEIRVAGLKEQIKANAPVVTTDGKTPQESFRLRVRRSACPGGRAIPTPERRHPAADGGTGHPLPAPLEMDRCPARVDSRLLLPRNDAGTDADRTRSLAPLPEGAQQEPQFRRRTRRQGCLRPQFQCGHRPGAARPAARHPDAGGNCRLRVRLRLHVVDPARVRRRTVHRHDGARLLPVPRDAQFATSSSTRKKSPTCAPSCRAN